MNIPPIGSGSPVARLQGSTTVAGNAGTQDVSRTTAQDTVEISDMARYLSELKKLPEIRQDKVDTARQAIASGTYETPEKLDTAISRLQGDLA